MWISKREYEKILNEMKELKSVIDEREKHKHNPNETCVGCKNLIEKESIQAGLCGPICSTMYFCKLNNECDGYVEQ